MSVVDHVYQWYERGRLPLHVLLIQVLIVALGVITSLILA